MKKFFRIFWISLLVLVFLGTMVFLWMKSRPEVQTWQLLSPQTRTIENSIIATGKVEPSNEVQIKPQISGIIDAIHYDPGDDIKIGDIIATIKVVPEMSSLNSAEGRLKVAEINYEKALREHKRNEELYGKGILSEEEFETSRTTLDNAKEEVDNSKDALKIITDGVSEKYDHLSNTLVRSTITGKILDIPVEVGNSVIQANTFNDGTTIATVADLGNMLFKGNIDESDVGKIRDGMPVKEASSGSTAISVMYCRVHIFSLVRSETICGMATRTQVMKKSCRHCSLFMRRVLLNAWIRDLIVKSVKEEIFFLLVKNSCCLLQEHCLRIRRFLSLMKRLLLLIH